MSRYGSVAVAWIVILGCTGQTIGQLADENPTSDLLSSRREALIERHQLTQRIDAALDRAVEFILSRQRQDGQWAVYEGFTDDVVGQTALMCLALLDGGLAHDDAQLERALASIRRVQIRTTYDLSMRAQLWARLDRVAEESYVRALKADAGRLGSMGTRGRYSYTPEKTAGGKWDNCNSHFGVMGLLAAERRSVSVPSRYWQNVLRHWRDCQNADGGWGYQDGTATVSIPSEGISYYGERTQATMVVVGLTTVLAAAGRLPLSDRQVDARGDRPLPMVVTAMEWLDSSLEESLDAPGFGTEQWYFYLLYGLKEAGQASGRRCFGNVDWLAYGAALLECQQSSGSFFRPVVVTNQANLGRVTDPRDFPAGMLLTHTAMSTSFLAAARQPVHVAKLAFEGDWNNRPRDAAEMTEYLVEETNQEGRWQVVSFGEAYETWPEAGVLLLSGHHALPRGPGDNEGDAATGHGRFDGENLDKLRAFVAQGGTILSVTQAEGGGFSESVRELYAELFPEYGMAACPADHPVRSAVHELDAKPDLFIISDGNRPIVIHSDEDLSLAWAQGRSDRTRWAFRAGENIIAYAREATAEQRAELVEVDDLVPTPAAETDDPASADPEAPDGQTTVDYILVLIDGSPYLAPGSAAGESVDLNGSGTVTVPNPHAANRVVVIDPSTGERYSIPKEYVGYTFPTPSGGTFVADTIVDE